MSALALSIRRRSVADGRQTVPERPAAIPARLRRWSAERRAVFLSLVAPHVGGWCDSNVPPVHPNGPPCAEPPARPHTRDVRLFSFHRERRCLFWVPGGVSRRSGRHGNGAVIRKGLGTNAP